MEMGPRGGETPSVEMAGMVWLLNGALDWLDMLTLSLEDSPAFGEICLFSY